MAVFATQSQAADLKKDSKSTSLFKTFFFKDASGSEKSAEIVTKYQPRKIVYPVAKIDPSIDPKLRRAATIAEERARAHSRSRCWHHVGLHVEVGVDEFVVFEVLRRELHQLDLIDRQLCPCRELLQRVDERRKAGHVELRTKDGFVSDFRSRTPSHRPLLGVYVKS